MLQPDKLKKLNDNALKMAEAGKSQEDILAMKDAFIEQFGSKEPVKKKVDSTSTTTSSKLVSGQKNGYSGTVKTVDDLLALTPKSQKSTKSQEVAYAKAIKKTPLIAPREINREEIAVPTKVDKQILAETPKQEITPLPQGFQEIADTNTFENVSDFETKQNQVKQKLVSDWEANTGLSYTERQQLQDDIEAEANTEGIWNNIKKYGQEAVNVLSVLKPTLASPSLVGSSDPLFEQKKQYKKQLIKSGIKESNITEKDVTEGAKKLLLNERADNARLVKYNNYLDNLPEEEKTIILKEKEKEKTDRSEKDKHYIDMLDLKQNDIESSNNRMQSILDKFNNNGQLSEEEIEYAKNYENNVKTAQQDYNKYHSEYLNNNEKLGTVQQEADALKRDYSVNGSMERFALNLAKIGVGLASFANMSSPSSPSNVVTGLELADIQNNINTNLQEKYRKQTKGFQGYEDAKDYAVDLLTDQAPNLLLMSATGGGSALGVQGSKSLAMSAVGAYSAGNEMNRLIQSNVEGKSDYTIGQMYMASLGNGLANSIETGTLNTIFKGKRLIGASLAKGELQPLLKQSLAEKTKGLSKDLAKQVGTEMFEETATTFLTNATKKYILNDKDVNLTDDFIKTMKDSATMSFMLGASPHLVVATMNPFIKSEYSSKLDQNGKEMARLTQELQNTNLTEESKAVIQKSIDLKAIENKTILNSVINTIDGLNDEQKRAVLELENKSSDLRVEAESIQNDKSVSKETKQIALNDLKAQYSKSEELRKNIVDGKTTILDVVPDDKKEEMKSNALNVLLSETEGSNEAQFTNEVIEQKAIELYNNQIQSKDAKTETPITETESQAEVQKPTDEKQEIQEVVEKQEKGDSDVNGDVRVTDNTDLQDKGGEQDVSGLQSATNKGESKPDVKRVKSLKDAEYDVSFDEDGNVSKINSVKDGREIPKFIERVNPKTNKTTLVKNANYARIEADSKGEQLDSRIKSDDKKSFDDVVLKFEPTTEYDVALKALATGAKVSMESLQKELGNTDQKWATNQSKSEQLPSIEKLSEQIWEESGGQLDQMEIRNQLIDLIQTNQSVDGLKAKLVESHNSIENQKRDEELNTYLGSLSEKDLSNYESIKAEDDYISELSDEEATQYYEQEYLKSTGQTKKEDNGKESTNEVGETKTPSVQKRDGEEVESKSEEKEINESEQDFIDSLKIVPNGETKDYISGKNIEKYTGDKPQNNQEYLELKLTESLEHGIDNVSKAKELFGENYVNKTMEFLKKNKIDEVAELLTLITLENELVNNIKKEIGDVELQQSQLKKVRDRSQFLGRKGSKLINLGRLRKFAEIGFDITKLTEGFFSEKTKEAKKSIEETIQVKSEDVNKQDDAEQSGEITDDLKALIQEEIDKEINEIYKKLPAGRKARAEKAITALEKIQKNLRKNTYDATIGVPIAIIDGGITVIKNAIKAGVSIADAIELGIDNIKNKYNKDWEKESQFRKDMSEAFKSENIDLKEKSKADESTKGIVKQALIDAGYSREVTLNGEKVKRLDWVKLAGEEGSVENIKSKVEEVLQKEGYSKKRIEEMKISLEEEYNRLSAEIIQKGLNELEKRNLIKPSPNRKSESKRLAELYNMGLLEKNENEYDNLLNKVLGLSEFEQNIFNKIKAKTKALSDIYNAEVNGKKITEHSLQTVANDLNHEIKELLNAVSYKEGDFKYKLITLLTDYAGLSQKALLGGLPNLIENVMSGRFAGLEQKLYTDKVLTPELRKQIKKDKKVIYNDITKNAGLYYGDTNTSLVSSSRFEDWVNGKTDNRVAHAVISAITLRSWLDGADSRSKVGLSSKLFIKNAVEILTSKSNPNGAMKREDAIKFVSESLTGDKFKEALETSKAIIDDINSKQDKKQLKDTPEAIHRFAMNLVKENLMQDNRMTMEQIETAFKSGYKSAGRDIGHEANNPISRSVNMLNASLTAELEKAVSEKRYGEATALSAKMMVLRTIINPFVGGGTNWVILGLEKSGNPLGYISTIFNATKKQELDLGTVSGIKNMSEALYRKNNYQASLTRNIIGTSVALALFAGMNIDIDDEEDAKDKLNKWLEENKWAKRYFEKLSPEALVFMISLENKELGKHLAKNLGINGDTFNNTSKLLKSLDKETTSTSGKAGQVVGSPLNSPLAWKTVKDVQNIVRGLKGLPEIKTDYKATGFWNGYFQGGLIEFLGMRPDKENTAEKPKESKSKSKYSKF